MAVPEDTRRRYLYEPAFHQLVHFLVQVLGGYTMDDLAQASSAAVEIIAERKAKGEPQHQAAVRPCPTCGHDMAPDYADYLATFPLNDPRR